MSNATDQMIQLDLKHNRARQYATMILMEIKDHIAPSAMRHAIYELADMFYKNDVVITTAEQRKLDASLK